MLLVAAASAVGATDPDTGHNLTAALRRNDVATLTRLLDENPDILQASAAAGRPAAVVAAGAGSLEALRLIVERGVALFPEKAPDRVLRAAVAGGHPQVVEFLLTEASRDDALERRLGGAVLAAVEAGSAELLGQLLEAGVLPDARDVHGATALHYAASAGRADLALLLLDAGVDVDAVDHQGRNALAVRPAGPEGDEVGALLAARIVALRVQATGGADTVEQRTLASVAARQVSGLKVGLTAGVDPATADSRGRTLLMVAAEVGCMDCLALLLAEDVEVDAQLPGPGARAGWTALFAAAAAGRAEAVQALLDAGADVNHRSATGRTALFFAALGGHRQAVDVLLDARARLDVLDREGLKAADLAAAINHTAIAAMLEWED
jgi:ankyrin repeat protein